MRIAFFVNSIKDEHPHFTTTVFALAALARGHEVCYITPGDFVLREDDTLHACVLTLPRRTFKKAETLHKALHSDETTREVIDITEIDVLMLRNDPSQDAETHPWAAQAGPMFGRLAADRGVLVVNDPDGLALAQNKLYLQGFPEAVRPPSLISKNLEEIRDFIGRHPKGVIIKPLQGSGGKHVFKIDGPNDANINQIFEAVSEEGYMIAQGYMPKAKDGDIRVFVMNGSPLERDGKYAALRRVPAKGDVRSNMHAKGTAVKVEMTDEILAVADLVRPKLIHDGLFMVGLDIVGDKILEINVFTPGGLWSICDMYNANFAETVLMSLEKKIEMREGNQGNLSNRELAIL
ncbi:glutathione synthetase [Pseudoruegeria sp. SK021]|uniref:glutathione synthetase n=1 Tax=Pseudoruegeria sp. SK021 TaxID=1933035 RepID=UPI000A21724E|nr:glutathione synthetase [Pseudoruegeria sp. SK021]OSP54836.1 glutathione synthetase [Pseudoruegeria sp. SK021]